MIPAECSYSVIYIYRYYMFPGYGDDDDFFCDPRRELVDSLLGFKPFQLVDANSKAPSKGWSVRNMP